MVCIDPASPLLERLGDFGLMQGTHIRCERVSLFGDPVAYRILPAADPGDGTGIALRRRAAGVRTRGSPATCVSLRGRRRGYGDRAFP